MEKLRFITGTGKIISFFEMLREINNFINEKKGIYKVMIGTDSEIDNNFVDFVSAVVVHRVGFGARFFYRRWQKSLSFYETENKKSIYLINQRIWEEVINSLDLAKSLIENFKNINPQINFELHIDVGYNGKTSQIIQELMNYIRGYGFEVKVKPNSFAASKVADKFF
jgi:predicted RNase H-related nuclease YkuK (DUF458 family)